MSKLKIITQSVLAKSLDISRARVCVWIKRGIIPKDKVHKVAIQVDHVDASVIPMLRKRLKDKK